MSDYDSVFAAAMQLPADDRLRLIEDLGEAVEVEPESPLPDDWLAEIERRINELEDGGETIPWLEVRDAAILGLRIDS